MNTKLHEVSGNHLVQFYENDEFLIDGLSDYIGSALAQGDKGIVIATRPHLDALETNLLARGLLPLQPPAAEGSYVALEAHGMLPLFMVDDAPDEERFTHVIGGVIEDAARNHPGGICVFGEMVAILCDSDYHAMQTDGKHAAAIQVERCFNSLLRKHRFSLLCGYPMSAFPREEDAPAFHKVCALHTNVIPTESFNASAGINDLQRTIATLQQKAFSLVSEVNQRLLIEQALHEVNFDKLTGLPNRSVFQDRLQMEIHKAHRGKSAFALLFIDLDHFKEINDTLGHDVGDRLLAQVAERLSASVREIDTVARLGGDEFTVVLSEVEDAESVAMVTDDILRKLTEPFELGADCAYVSASIGITLCPSDAVTVADLLKNADQAMYASKDSGRNQATYFTRSMQEAAQRRMRISSELRNALPDKQLRLLYQPIVDMATGATHKAEALLRWQHPVQGLVNPVEFIPIAEHTGMIVDIGEWVFYEAAHQAQAWRRRDPDFQVSINVSPAQFQKGLARQFEWIDFLQRIGRSTHAPLKEISIEITEGLLLTASTSVTRQLLAFRDAGVQVSLDDFGTGYSSLSYLRKFDIDYLKIDRSFVTEIETETDHLALCEAIIVMAHKLGLKVIAEGIENRFQADLLAAAGCDFGQGFLFSAPVPGHVLEQRLRS